jgi:hypothetical protein
MRRRAAAIAVVALGLGGLVVQGCGGSGGDLSGPAGEPGTGQLEITYIPEPGRTPRTAMLVCPATDVDEQQACEQIESLSDAFDPVPADVACTEVYGGPEQISLMGTWAGERVRTTLTRTNGCEIDRYEALAPVLLPLVGGPGGG